jgi:hypothetical protein
MTPIFQTTYLVNSLKVGVFIGRFSGLELEVAGVDVEASVGRRDVRRHNLKRNSSVRLKPRLAY